MASYNQLYVHLVWSTWQRLPLITPELEPHVYAALASKCTELKCKPIAINGIADHVHILAGITTTISIAKLVGAMKGSSAYLIAHRVTPGTFFKWQHSYGAFTVSKRAVPIVRRYILNQKIHHAKGKLLPEYEQFEEEE